MQEVDLDKVNLQICQSAVDIAHSMNRCVVAEGVETFRQMEVMKAIDCDVVQGYFISKPIYAEAYIEFLKSN